MPGARWKPAYDLHYASARGQIRVETAAVVEQATGEDWTDADAAAVDGDARAAGSTCPSSDLDARRAERVRAAAAPAPAAAGRAAAAVPAGAIGRRRQSRALDAEMVRARLAQAIGTEARTTTASGVDARRARGARHE